MSPARFAEITSRYASLRIVLVGDFCLDRYLEIDPAREERSIETGLAVHNVVRVRSQPGGAGTILNNLVALGAGTIHAVGFCGEDGEGYELRRALQQLPGVGLTHFQQTSARRTFTYCKPLIIRPHRPPEELNRLDTKNWEPTPPMVEDAIINALGELTAKADAVIALDQVDIPDTGVITARVRDKLGSIAAAQPGLLIFADSRRGLKEWPAVGFKMNVAELAAFHGQSKAVTQDEVRSSALKLARSTGRPVVITLAERGAVGALPDGTVEEVPALPVRGPIDIVGAGDAVTANVTMALAAGAGLREALELAMAAASIVVHQLGTTGTATVAALRERVGGS